jgi:hypothetical protein
MSKQAIIECDLELARDSPTISDDELLDALKLERFRQVLWWQVQEIKQNSSIFLYFLRSKKRLILASNLFWKVNYTREVHGFFDSCNIYYEIRNCS